jgi:regulator of protease activity HflC (stomatin/prohibitin superfamily)
MFLEILQAITGIFVVVYDGQHALRFTLGRAQEVVGPGIHFKWPIIQRFQVRETKDTTLELEPQVIQLKDDLVYEVGARVVYQIVDLRKAVIEIDNLVTGMRNRLVLAVQRVVRSQDRESIRDMGRMIAAVRKDLRVVEDEWGVVIHEFGFSTFSPTPETLEVTQLRKLAEEKLHLYERFRDELGLGEGAAVALISGAVIAVRGTPEEPRPPRPKPAAAEEEPEAEPAEGADEGGGLGDGEGKREGEP